MTKIKYILVLDYWPSKEVKYFKEFKPFQDEVNTVLAMETLDGDPSKLILFAGEVSAEWEFKPVEKITKYKWSEKKES